MICHPWQIPSLDEMAWAIPQYSRTQVDAAGDLLAERRQVDAEGNPIGGDAGFDHALDVINNWRSSHSYPLNTFQMGLRQKIKHIRPPWLVAQRIKRLPAIALKLELNKSMQLSQMQDIGGCRAVVSTVNQVYELVSLWGTSKAKHELLRVTDYVKNPRSTGYRSVHLVYRFQSDGHPEYNGLRIEMQLRSRLQHAWATAVETTGDFIGQALKSNLGSEAWLRFFRLMSGAIALEENTKPVPRVSDSNAVLRRELRSAMASLNVVGTLQTFGQIAQIRTNIAGAELFLIATNPLGKTVRITGFRRAQSERAMEEYAATEKTASGVPGAQVVLVSVDSIKKLKRAYPSYFLESRVFLSALRRATAR